MFGFVSSTGFRVLDSLLLYTMAMQTVQIQRHHEHLSVTQEDEKQYHDVKMNNYLNYDCFPVLFFGLLLFIIFSYWFRFLYWCTFRKEFIYGLRAKSRTFGVLHTLAAATVSCRNSTQDNT